MTMGGVDGSLAVDDTRGIFAMNLATLDYLTGVSTGVLETSTRSIHTNLNPPERPCSIRINFQLTVSAKPSFLSHPILLYQLY